MAIILHLLKLYKHSRCLFLLVHVCRAKDLSFVNAQEHTHRQIHITLNFVWIEQHFRWNSTRNAKRPISMKTITDPFQLPIASHKFHFGLFLQLLSCSIAHKFSSNNYRSIIPSLGRCTFRCSCTNAILPNEDITKLGLSALSSNWVSSFISNIKWNVVK